MLKRGCKLAWSGSKRGAGALARQNSNVQLSAGRLVGVESARINHCAAFFGGFVRLS